MGVVPNAECIISTIPAARKNKPITKTEYLFIIFFMLLCTSTLNEVQIS